MKKEDYFEIYHGEDGITIKKIDDIDLYLEAAVEDAQVFSSTLPLDSYEAILIKGRIVKPKEVEVVMKYEIGE